MRKSLAIILTLLGFLAFGQENNLERIDNAVNSIELDSTLVLTEFDWTKLTGITTDGGGILKVWRNDNQICKVVQEIGLSYGRVKTVIFLSNGLPIKIIETEENFGHKNDELDYGKLNEVFKATIHVYDWENDESKIERVGKRVMSEGDCSNFDYEPIIERAEKATSE
tara:strand:+ start:350 stop:853 length:504 start_codon:yes stop_codon:yes gene_type:complete